MTIQQLDQDTDFLCGSTSWTYPIADKRRNQNIAYQDVARTIWESDGDWSFDDRNNTDTPVAYQTLGDLSANYLIPTTALRIKGVEVKSATGHWNKLKEISYHEFTTSPDEFLSGGGLPLYYRPDGNELFLYPAPTSADVTLSAGLMVRLSRNVTDLSLTATTTEPGFATPFHRILSLAAAIDFESTNEQRNFFAQQKQRLEQGLTRFYSKRLEEGTSKIRPSIKKRWKSYL